MSHDGEALGSRARSPRARRYSAGAVAAIVVAGLVVATAGAALTASYADPAGDGNAAPDITGVTVDGSDPGRLRVRVAVGNLEVLPPRSQITVRFDLDRNSATGGGGDELTVRLTDAGVGEVLRWNGTRLLAAPIDGVSMRFAAGVFDLELDRALLGGSTSFALLAVSGRTQATGSIAVVTSTDFAPHSGRSVYSLPGAVSFPDPRDDQDEAPDITKISVSDTKAETVVVRITVANYRVLPADKILSFDLDLAGRPASADDVLMTFLSGLDRPTVERERDGAFSPSPHPNRSTGSFAKGVLTMTLPRSELDGASSFEFGAIGLDLVGAEEGEGDDIEGEVEAMDLAPDLTKALPRHRLANPGPLQLRAERIGATTSARPRANARFVWGVRVRRLDTYETLRKGSVTCTASVSGRPIRVAGRFLNERIQCSGLVPRGTRSRLLRSAITVRSSGSSVRARFSAVIE